MPEHSQLPTSLAPTTGSDAVDAEHGIQLGLLEASLTALSSGAADTAEIIDQLHGYTQAHFLSEQLLMRLAARGDYDGHLEDHERLMRELDEAKAKFESGDSSAAAGLLKSHEKHLLEHIRSWDRSIEMVAS
jgi:hemerythrin